MRKYLKRAMLVAIIIVAALMIVNILYFFSGSVEFYPTEKQEEKVKLVTGLIFFVLFIVEAILVVFYRKINT